MKNIIKKLKLGIEQHFVENKIEIMQNILKI
jgi:hypothetical protein